MNAFPQGVLKALGGWVAYAAMDSSTHRSKLLQIRQPEIRQPAGQSLSWWGMTVATGGQGMGRLTFLTWPTVTI